MPPASGADAPRERSALLIMIVGSVIMVGGLVFLVMRNDPTSGEADSFARPFRTPVPACFSE